MTTPYPTDNDRDRTADVDPLDRPADGDLDRADHAPDLDPADRPADDERSEYSVDQVGDDQAPLDTVTEPVTYPADVEPVDNDRLNDNNANAERTDADSVDADATPVNAAPTTAATPATSDATDEKLVPTTEAVDFKARWDVVQQGFVDDPRSAVTDADKLVSDVLDRLSATFDEQHKNLEGQWSDGEPSTEDLRSALQKYRAFFQRLLTI